jgi:fructose-1,6-bisphosphatase/inositol monophosphatase family enzyme
MATFTPKLRPEVIMADDKMKPEDDDKKKPEDMVPQADKQAHTEIAEREGREGGQARVINKEEAEKRDK